MKGSYIKSGILLLLIIHFSSFLQAQDSLLVHNTNGQQHSFLIGTIDKLTFPGENMLITFKSTSTTNEIISPTNYPLSEIQYYNFKYNSDWNPVPTPKYTFRVFPNPTQDEISIESSIPIYEIILYDILGQKLKQVLASPEKTVLSLSNYPAGFYVLQIMTSIGIMSEKIIKN